jgi:hypothetical protein
MTASPHEFWSRYAMVLHTYNNKWRVCICVSKMDLTLGCIPKVMDSSFQSTTIVSFT